MPLGRPLGLLFPKPFHSNDTITKNIFCSNLHTVFKHAPETYRTWKFICKKINSQNSIEIDDKCTLFLKPFHISMIYKKKEKRKLNSVISTSVVHSKFYKFKTLLYTLNFVYSTVHIPRFKTKSERSQQFFHELILQACK